MKYTCLLLFFISSFYGCTMHSPTAEQNTTSIADSGKNYFPVTNYLRGQIATLREGYKNPVKITEHSEQMDSTWISMDSLEKVFADFLVPQIDTVNMKPYFTENAFLDETLNSFTFTYSKKQKANYTGELHDWTVYVSPENNEVTRLFMHKQASPAMDELLTWDAENKSASLVRSKDGKVFAQEKYTWNY